MGERILGNRYQIIRKIGDGGMAFVYEAKDRLLNRIVAVKTLRPEFADDEEFLSKFKREAEAVANINHPNIVNVYDVGEENKTHYIVMEYVDGKNLKEIIKDEGILDEYTALDITKQIAKALSAAHKKGVIHRDIKPHNILISNEGRQVKVADFGIAKAVSNATITNIGSIIGSVHYFSPEQAKGQPVANNADLYSLGIVLYEMIIGNVPFRGDSPISIALQHINENIEFTQEEKTRIPHSVRTLISKLTEKSAEDRYQSAEEVIEDIEYIEKNIDLDFIKEYDSYVTKKIDSDKILSRSKNYEHKKRMNDDLEKEELNIRKEKPKKENKDNYRKKSKSKLKPLLLGALLILALGLGGFYIKDRLQPSSVAGSDMESIPVPDFEGKDINDVSKEANNLGIYITQKEEYSNNVEKGFVISQSPYKGSMLQPGDSVTVVVSLGKKEVSIPNCVGMTEDGAIALLQQNHLQVGKKTYEYSSSFAKGDIIRQSPEASTQGDFENTKVDLVISKGKKPQQTTKPSEQKPTDDNQNDSNNQGSDSDKNNSTSNPDNGTNDGTTNKPGDNSSGGNSGGSSGSDDNSDDSNISPDKPDKGDDGDDIETPTINQEGNTDSDEDND